MFNVKKILIVALFFLIVIGTGLAIYLVFFKPAELPTVPGETVAGVSTGLPTSGEAGDRGVALPDVPERTLPASDVAIGGPTLVQPITAEAVVSPTLTNDGLSVNFYNPGDGKFYKVDASGQQLPITNRAFRNASEVKWDNKGNKALLEFPDGSNVVYDTQTDSTFTLPRHWEEFEFSPSGEQIAAKSIGTDPLNRWLVISNSDGTNTQQIAALGNNADKVQVNWSPNDQIIAFSDTGTEQTGFSRKMIVPIGKNDENFKGLIVEGFGFESTWSPTGNKLLYSVHGAGSDYLPTLWLVDGSGDDIGNNRRNIGLNTWVDKCTYASTSEVFCAVPENLPKGAGLQRELAFGIPDVVYKVDTSTGQVNLVGQPAGEESMTNLQVSSDGSYLFYQNERTGRLEQMKLR